MEQLKSRCGMPDPSLVAACITLFSDRASIATKLKAFLQKDECLKGSDQDALAKLRAAVDLLYARLISDAGVVSQRRFAEAEVLCMQLLQRPCHSVETARLHAWARFGTAIINFVRNEPEVCAIKIAHAFAIDPRWSRNTFSELFEAVFRPSCDSIYRQAERDEAKARRQAYYAPIIVKRAGAVAMGVGVLLAAASVAVGVSALIGMKNIVPPGVMVSSWIKSTAVPMWQSANDTNAREAAVTRIRRICETQLDQKCQILALAFL
jgi:hypothetical protein